MRGVYWASVIRTFDIRADGTLASKTSHGVIVQKILHINRSKYLMNVYLSRMFIFHNVSFSIDQLKTFNERV